MNSDTSINQNNSLNGNKIETHCFNCKNELTDRHPQLLSCLHSLCEECVNSTKIGMYYLI